MSEAEESDFDEIEFLDNNFITPQTYLQTVELESIKVAFKDQEFSNLFCCVSRSAKSHLIRDLCHLRFNVFLKFNKLFKFQNTIILN